MPNSGTAITYKRRIKKCKYHICLYCKEAVINTDVNIEHIIPKSWGGKSIKLNLAIACKLCNSELGKISYRLRRKIFSKEKFYQNKLTEKQCREYLYKNHIPLLFQEYLLYIMILEERKTDDGLVTNCS